MRKKRAIILIISLVVASISLGGLGIWYFFSNIINIVNNDEKSSSFCEWTWISGNKTASAYGEYGIKRVPDLSNFPGSRRDSVSWIDSKDNLWLFGGAGFAESGSYGHLNDLWKFNGSSWTWISGNKTTGVNGVYGTKGVPDLSNCPGARADSVSWIDSEDNLWLFGGGAINELVEYDHFNDLWKFNGSSWTWISGNKTVNVHGEYGTKGVPDLSNCPGARTNSVSWIDSEDTLWLFGGRGYDELGVNGYLNDLWKFNGSSWTWISGNKTTGVNGVYGTKGVPDSSNLPGSRICSVSWIDSEDTLWLFGGWAYIEPGRSEYLNDLWKFNGTFWTWISGNKTSGISGVYGIKGVPDALNIPGSRINSISWTDSKDNLWLFGGHGHADISYEVLNDLWKFNGTCWTWISGDKICNVYGEYGTKGIPDALNIPGSRYSSVGGIDTEDNLWLFGGAGNAESESGGLLNDLWKCSIL